MQVLIVITGAFNFLFIFTLTLSHPQKPKEQFLINLADVPCGKRSSAVTEELRSQTSTSQWQLRSQGEKISPKTISQVDGRRSRIIGGSSIVIEQSPWSVSIQNEWGTHFCGGFIISRRFILTASHCFIHYMLGVIDEQSLKKMNIVVGTSNLTKLGSSQTLKIQRLTLHPDFSYLYPDFENDIAVIKTDQDIQWNDKVQPSCLSSTSPVISKSDKNLSKSKISAHKVSVSLDEAAVAGWGLRAEDQLEEEWSKSVMLNQVWLKLWTNSACQRAYEKHGIEWNIKDSHICTSGQKKDTCRGDSGSALVSKSTEDNSWIAIGIVSGGEGCSNPLPGIYTKISYFMDTGWIMSVINADARV